MTLRTESRIDADVAVIGSGFAGALTALALRQSGRQVVLLERGRHPRFAIGESTTPLTNLLLEDLAERYDLPQVRPFSKWSTWRRTRPDLDVGLKRGFTFLFHRPGEPFADDADRTRQLLVAASPNDEAADTHWFRPGFDRALVEQAAAAGVDYLDDVALETARSRPSGMTLDGTRQGRRLVVDAGFVVDASGPRGFLATALRTGDMAPAWMPPTQGLYTHFQGVARWADIAPPVGEPPYPPDDAALHHVFPGGWIWVLRFASGLTSAGAALTDPLAAQVVAADGAEAWARLLQTLPSVQQQFERSHPTRPFVHASRIAFRTREVTGEHWAMLPSAAGVIDPLLSTGFPLTLLGIGRLVALLDSTRPGSARQAALAAYSTDTQDELDVTERLVAGLYASMADPELFKRLSLLYFAAASYSETVRRIQRPDLAPGFLLHNHPVFGPELRACASAALAAPQGQARIQLLDRIDRAIAPFDAAGLGDHTRRGWYPVLARDLIDNAAKLEASAEDVQRLLARCGLTAS